MLAEVHRVSMCYKKIRFRKRKESKPFVKRKRACECQRGWAHRLCVCMCYKIDLLP